MSLQSPVMHKTGLCCCLLCPTFDDKMIVLKHKGLWPHSWVCVIFRAIWKQKCMSSINCAWVCNCSRINQLIARRSFLTTEYSESTGDFIFWLIKITRCSWERTALTLGRWRRKRSSAPSTTCSKVNAPFDIMNTSSASWVHVTFSSSLFRVGPVKGQANKKKLVTKQLQYSLPTYRKNIPWLWWVAEEISSMLQLSPGALTTSSVLSSSIIFWQVRTLLGVRRLVEPNQHHLESQKTLLRTLKETQHLPGRPRQADGGVCKWRAKRKDETLKGLPVQHSSTVAIKASKQPVPAGAMKQTTTAHRARTNATTSSVKHATATAFL